MKWFLYICCTLFVYIHAQAQYTQGVIRSSEDNKYLENVLVVNANTQAYTYSDDSGYYKLRATGGDTIVFMAAAYQTVKHTAGGTPVAYITMKRTIHMLHEVEVLSAQEKWEQEHTEMLSLYNKPFTDAKRKPTTTLNGGSMIAGVTVDGLITEMAARISGQKKKDKRFLKDFEQTEAMKFIETRYNPEVVMSATGTTYDSAVRFIYHYPMEVGFVRDATSLEFLMWIRDNYRKWLLKTESPADSTNHTN